MTTLNQLRMQISRLKQESKARERTVKRNTEVRMLKKQLFVLKHPRLVRSAAAGLSIGKSGLTSLISAAKKYHQYQQSKKRR